MVAALGPAWEATGIYLYFPLKLHEKAGHGPVTPGHRRWKQKALCEFKTSLKIHSEFPDSKEHVSGKKATHWQTLFRLTVPKTQCIPPTLSCQFLQSPPLLLVTPGHWRPKWVSPGKPPPSPGLSFSICVVSGYATLTSRGWW